MTQPAPKPGNWLSGINFNIIGQQVSAAGDAAVAAVGGPGFSLSPDEAHKMLNDARGILDDLRPMMRKAEGLTHITPPADEPASNGYNAQLVGNGQNLGAFGAGNNLTQRMYGYVSELVDRLEEALGITKKADQQAGTDVKKAAPADGSLF